MVGPVSAEWALANFRNVSRFGDDVRLRFTLLSPLCEVALAKSRPPQNIPGNPEDIHYLLARKRSADDEEFVYTAAIEPYLRERRSVAAIRALVVQNGGGSDSAVEVRFRDGRRDVIVQCADDSRTVAVEGGIWFRGALMLARFAVDGAVAELLAVRPSSVRIGEAVEREYVPCARGTVVAFDRGTPASCTVTAGAAIVIPPDAMRPLWTDITPTADANGNYPIESITERDGRTVLNLGDTSLISGFDRATQQYTYAFAEGATLTIPFSYYWRRGER
jgi:hypothetical protein